MRLSNTEARLADLVDRLAHSIVGDGNIVMIAGEEWSVDVNHEPPILTYRVADAAVLGDETLSVTAHEIAHLLYTTAFRYEDMPWDTVGQNGLAQLLIFAVEDRRIELNFAERFPGAASLFFEKNQAQWTAKAIRGFPSLPAKWRFILNVNRVLNGHKPLGPPEDAAYVVRCEQILQEATLCDSTQEMADRLGPAFAELIAVVAAEEKARQEAIKQHEEKLAREAAERAAEREREAEAGEGESPEDADGMLNPVAGGSDDQTEDEKRIQQALEALDKIEQQEALDSAREAGDELQDMKDSLEGSEDGGGEDNAEDDLDGANSSDQDGDPTPESEEGGAEDQSPDSEEDGIPEVPESDGGDGDTQPEDRDDDSGRTDQDEELTESAPYIGENDFEGSESDEGDANGDESGEGSEDGEYDGHTGLSGESSREVDGDNGEAAGSDSGGPSGDYSTDDGPASGGNKSDDYADSDTTEGDGEYESDSNPDNDGGDSTHSGGSSSPDSDGESHDVDGEFDGGYEANEETITDADILREAMGEDTAPPDVKATSIIDEMVNDLRDDDEQKKNPFIVEKRNQIDKRAKDARRVEKEIKKEGDTTLLGIAEDFGLPATKTTMQALKTMMNQRDKRYDLALSDLQLEIATLKRYAMMVLKENQTNRYGGNYTSGKRIKTNRLFRVLTGDPRLFEKKIVTQGRSYAIGLNIDQSGSMGGYRPGSRQILAFQTAVILAEAFEGMIETAITGFAQCFPSKASRGSFVHGKSRFGYNETLGSIYTRLYKGIDDDLKVRRAVMAELTSSYGYTPMGEGLESCFNEVNKSDAEVRSMITIADGDPGSIIKCEQVIEKAHKEGISNYLLMVGPDMSNAPRHTSYNGRLTYWARLDDAMDHIVYVKNASEVPMVTMAILRQIIKKNLGAA